MRFGLDTIYRLPSQSRTPCLQWMSGLQALGAETQHQHISVADTIVLPSIVALDFDKREWKQLYMCYWYFEM